MPSEPNVPSLGADKKQVKSKFIRAKPKKPEELAMQVPECDPNDNLTVDAGSGRLQLVESKFNVRVAKASKTNILDLSSSRALNSFKFEFTSGPREIFGSSMRSLRELWLTNNKIPVLTGEIRAMTNLRTFGLGGNELTGIPSEITSLQNLERLFLDRNKIASIPPQIGQLLRLVELRLDHKHIHHFPEITGIRSLKRLGLSFNKLSKIPPEIRRLANLTELDLDNNQISELPQNLGHLRLSLKQLGLSNNQLAEKPTFLDQMPKLCIVRLSGNRKSGYTSKDQATGEAMLAANIPVTPYVSI
jgi:Leucine-rich repeat (LRR) protein